MIWSIRVPCWIHIESILFMFVPFSFLYVSYLAIFLSRTFSRVSNFLSPCLHHYFSLSSSTFSSLFPFRCFCFSFPFGHRTQTYLRPYIRPPPHFPLKKKSRTRAVMAFRCDLFFYPFFLLFICIAPKRGHALFFASESSMMCPLQITEGTKHYGPEQSRIQTKVAGYSLVCLLTPLTHSLAPHYSLY